MDKNVALEASLSLLIFVLANANQSLRLTRTVLDDRISSFSCRVILDPEFTFPASNLHFLPKAKVNYYKILAHCRIRVNRRLMFKMIN